MHTRKIIDKKTGRTLIRFLDEEIESIDPIKYYRDTFIFKQLVLRGASNELLNGKLKLSTIEKKMLVESFKLWEENLTEIKETIIPNNLKLLLETTKKSEQDHLLKDLELTPNIIAALIFEAYSLHGFKYSRYRTEIAPAGIDLSKMPPAFELKEDGQLIIYGKTELSDGQLRDAIKNRKVLIGEFIEKNNYWHCFFTSYNNLNGGEKWLGINQPHFHYLSSGYSLTKEKVLVELKSKKYSLGNAYHIKLIEYGNQPK